MRRNVPKKTSGGILPNYLPSRGLWEGGKCSLITPNGGKCDKKKFGNLMRVVTDDKKKELVRNRLITSDSLIANSTYTMN